MNAGGNDRAEMTFSADSVKPGMASKHIPHIEVTGF